MFPAFTFGLYPVLLFTMLPYYLNTKISWGLTWQWGRVMSDCCLTPIQQFFSYIMAKTS
jgi:hypothetical protein